MIRIGVDVGGTFTDVTALDTEAETFHVLKLPTTVEDQSKAVTEGILGVLEGIGKSPADVSYLGHGTTAATNALLELRGAKTALLTTKGFANVLEIARQKRPSLYDLFADKPRTLVPNSLTVEVDERLYSDGSARVPLTEAEVARVVKQVKALDVQAVAICLLHSYRNSQHEEALEEALRSAIPDLYISRSSAVAPEFREYERFSTTVINSFVGPEMNLYVTRLEDRTRAAGVQVGLKVIQSNGGLTSPRGVAEKPVTTLLSGPSAGVIAAIYTAQAAGVEQLITFDMGGTSTDVCLIRGGSASTASEREVAGYPVRIPSVNVHTVGAGGGSIASVDAAGGLKVGPESAGSFPGPAAYGHGGQLPTTTDANVVRRRQNPKYALGGKMPIDSEAAQASLERLSKELDMGVLEAARGVHRLANSNMGRAVRKVSIDAGEDPREFTLVAYGGAGPLHAVEVAAEVGMRKVLIPPFPGTLCALGLLVSDVKTEMAKSFLAAASQENLEVLNQHLAQLVDQAHRWLEEEAAIAISQEVYATADVRYPRQNFELAVRLPALHMDNETLAETVADFHEAHQRAYGFCHPDSVPQIVNVRVVAHGHVRKYPLPTISAGADTVVTAAVIDYRDVDFGADSGPVSTPVMDRAALQAGNRFSGPAIIEQSDTTTVIPPTATVEVDRFGNLLIEVEPA
ncbi:hydantoinase/oxoprolinase family protein [Pseudarthrobacter sp. RMG13]|uniref:Hydantoinase/oxoprolinase family protein n=1 Tax=Pseudarthrobacter humi TaxID=2952523 RepID=A0ABT1LVY6_9MICC|nr:hydantoinase/oxoprolinase family protein [Pseudarthrobacter humi]MCP9002069.1 hydantoinase/oxoprolinase family protein [Pseudarthrobacter humi]